MILVEGGALGPPFEPLAADDQDLDYTNGTYTTVQMNGPVVFKAK